MWTLTVHLVGPLLYFKALHVGVVLIGVVSEVEPSEPSAAEITDLYIVC